MRDGINFNQESVLTLLKPKSAKAVEAFRIAVLTTVICASVASTQEFRPEFRDLEEIRKSGELVMALPDNAPALFMYDGRPMGYEYELSKAFADSIGVSLKVVSFSQWSDMLAALKKGSVDIAAPGYPVQSGKNSSLCFTEPYMNTRSTVVTHRDNNGQTLQKNEDSDLLGIQQHVINNDLNQHSRASFDESSRLIGLVAKKQLSQTITDEHIARNALRYYPEMMIAESMGPYSGISWVTAPNSRNLLHRINSFFYESRGNGLFEELDERYLSKIDGIDKIDGIAFLEKFRKSFPGYRNIIKKESKIRGFDWRFITALIFQESSFNHTAEGEAGAAGLMQLLPSTAAELGASDPMNPSVNIKAGVKYLKCLFDMFPGETENDRLSFALAAYNIGPRHVIDAKEIAPAKGLNPLRWEDVSYILGNLKKGRHSRRKSWSYSRGDRAVDYVKKIMAYYEILKYMEIKPPPVCIYDNLHEGRV